MRLFRSYSFFQVSLFRSDQFYKWLILEVTNFSKCQVFEVINFSKCHFFVVNYFMKWLTLEMTGFEVTNFGSNPFFQVGLFWSYSFPSATFSKWPVLKLTQFSVGLLPKIWSILKVIEFEVTYFPKLITSEVTHFRSGRFRMTHFQKWPFFRSDHDFLKNIFSYPNIVQTS